MSEDALISDIGTDNRLWYLVYMAYSKLGGQTRRIMFTVESLGKRQKCHTQIMWLLGEVNAMVQGRWLSSNLEPVNHRNVSIQHTYYLLQGKYRWSVKPAYSYDVCPDTINTNLIYIYSCRVIYLGGNVHNFLRIFIIYLDVFVFKSAALCNGYTWTTQLNIIIVCIQSIVWLI